MSLSQAAPRTAVARSEARRRAIVDLWLERLSILVLVGASLYVMIGDRPFSRDAIDHSTEISPINRYVWLSLLLLSLPVLWARRRQVVALALAGWPMLLLYAWFVASTSWALDQSASVRRVLLYIVVLAVGFTISVGPRRPHVMHLVMALCAGGVVLVDLLSWPVVPHIAMTELGFAGMHSQKNVTGGIALFAALALATYLPVARGRLMRSLLWVMLAAAAIVLVATLSATSISLGVAAAVVAPGAVWVLRGGPGGIVVALSLLVLLPLVGGLLYLASAGMMGWDPLAPIESINFTLRTDLWSFLVDNIRERPFLGTGFGSFWAIDPAVQPSLQTGAWFAVGADVANEGHNAYLDVAACTGLVGLALMLFVQWRAILMAAWFVRIGGSVFPLALLLVIGVHSMTESDMFTANSTFGSFFVLIAIGLEQTRLVLKS